MSWDLRPCKLRRELTYHLTVRMGGIRTVIQDRGEYTIPGKRRQHKSNLLYISRDTVNSYFRWADLITLECEISRGRPPS